MVYESSYESGRRPFVPDTKRGSWEDPNDFVYAGLALAFRMSTFSMSWFFLMESSVLCFLVSYTASIILYVVPFIIMQSFMGQFSTSGFISAFRLSPLFKGVGYVSLALNFCVLTYTSVFAVIPLVYLFASMQSTLPWSCEGFKHWAQNVTEEQEHTLCTLHIPNITEESSSKTNTEEYEYVNHHIPSALYFKTLFNDPTLFNYEDSEFTMSWQLILSTLLVWTIVALIVYKYFNTEKFGQMIRYSVWTLCGLLALLLIRFSFLPGSGNVFRHTFVPSWREVFHGLISIPIFGLSAFGPGWGLFITLASFNKFKTNVMKYSWYIGFGQMFIMLALELLVQLSELYFGEVTDDNYYSYVEHIWVLYLSTGSVMASMGWANFWSILFYFMLFLSSMLLIIMQLYSVLTTTFDEFDYLRERKTEVCFGSIGVMAAVSLYFSSNHGVTFFSALSIDTYVTQTSLNMLLILIVLWIYGRVRFQRDIEFMINEKFPTWTVNMTRFIAPLGMLLALALGIQIASWEHDVSNFIIDFYAIITIVIPWLCIPGYAIYCMLQTMGPIKVRFFRCCRPTDWYPVDAEDRQQYEQAMGNTDITQTLNEVKEDEVL